MNQVLVGGLTPGMASLIERQLPDVTVQVAETGTKVLEQLAIRRCQLLVLDDALPDVPAVDVLKQLTESAASASVPVIYCLPATRAEPAFRERVEKLGVRRFLLHPFEAEDLLASIQTLLNSNGNHHHDGAGGAGPERFSQSMERRLDVFDSVAVALLEGVPDEALFTRARAGARELSSLMMSIGRLEAARLARDIELLLDNRGGRASADALRMSELVMQLRTELDRPIAVGEISTLAETRPLLLLLDRRQEFADTVSLEAEARGLRFKATENAESFRDALREDNPAVVIIDLDCMQERANGLALIGESCELAPNVPVLVATSAASLNNRVAVARAGAYAFLRKPLSAGGAVDAVISAIRRTDVAGRRVLAVDDDPHALAELKQRLDPLRIQLVTLDDARKFWEAMEATRPDVVMLDMNTRDHSGLELCRVLRGDDRWAGIPVMVLGEGADAERVHLAFLAGADDFVNKPVLPSELVTRIANRLERLRVAQDTAGMDLLTGLARRQRCEEQLQTLIRLAARYQKPFSLAVINIDSLREVNETCGNAAGDAVLRRIARLLRNSFRLEDVLGRSGGDQFMLGALGLEKDDCVRRLQRIAEKFREETFHGGEAQMHVTFSAGVSSIFVDGMDLPALQHAAEDTLGFAKSMGGANVIASGWMPDRKAAVDVVDVTLVEQDAALAGLLLHALEQNGWSTRWFKDATEAIAQFCGPYPHLRARVILLEVDLAGRDGFAVLRALGHDEVLARSRVIMLTARATEPEVLKAFELGAFDHVAKPFSVPVLLRRIRRAIQS